MAGVRLSRLPRTSGHPNFFRSYRYPLVDPYRRRGNAKSPKPPDVDGSGLAGTAASFAPRSFGRVPLEGIRPYCCSGCCLPLLHYQHAFCLFDVYISIACELSSLLPFWLRAVLTIPSLCYWSQWHRYR